MNKKYTFEELLKEKHAAQYTGLDDDMPDAFDAWVVEAYNDPDRLDKYIEEYGERMHDLGQINK